MYIRCFRLLPTCDVLSHTCSYVGCCRESAYSNSSSLPHLLLSPPAPFHFTLETALELAILTFVHTSGYALLTHPSSPFSACSRVGDSPIAGAGAYVDQEVGGAAATGDGDVMMRFLPTYQTVESMRRGMSPTEAAEDAIRRIMIRYSSFLGAIIAVNKTGHFGRAGLERCGTL